MSDTANAVTQREIELKRSAVRRHVTYFAVITYTVVSAVTVGWLMWADKYDMAVAVLGGIGSMTGSILGFWFGARQQKAMTMNTEPDDRKGEDKKG